MKRIFIPIAVLLLFTCKSPEIESKTGKINIACIGDSITYGLGITNRSENSYPQKLSQLLGDDFRVENFGVNGSTLLNKGNKPYVFTAVYNKALKYDPDLVIIKLGTNDSKERNWKNSDQFISDYSELINNFRALKSNPEIFICTPVPAFSDNFGIRNDVIYNEIIPKIREVAESNDVELINLYDPLLSYSIFFPDTIHPDKSGAEIIAEHIYGCLIKNN